MNPESTETPKTPYAASYARKSDRNEDGVNVQHAINTKEASRDGYVVPPAFLFEDVKVSGETTSRPGWDALLAMIQAGDLPIERLYVRKMARLGRFDPEEHAYLRRLLWKHGVQLWFVESPNVDHSKGSSTENDAAIIMSAVEGVAAKNEHADIRTKTMTGRRQAILRRQYPLSMAPYGTVRWLCDKHEGVALRPIEPGFPVRKHGSSSVLKWATDGSVDAVKRMFDLAQQGHSYAEIARRLDQASFPVPHSATRKTPSGWAWTTVRGILLNPIYMGDLVVGDTSGGEVPTPIQEADLNGEGPIIYRGFMDDPPISSAQFQSVGRILGERRRRVCKGSSGTSFLFSGRVRCAACGRPWYGHRGGSGRIPYYRHDNNHRDAQHCVHKDRYVPRDQLHGAVLPPVLKALEADWLRDAVGEEIRRRLEQKVSPSFEAETDLLRTELQQNRKTSAQVLVQKAQCSDPELLRIYDEEVLPGLTAKAALLKHQISERETEVERLRKAEETFRTRDSLRPDLVQLHGQGTDIQRRAVLESLVETIRFDPATGQVAVQLALLPKKRIV